jgi:hypothetical protein
MTARLTARTPARDGVPRAPRQRRLLALCASIAFGTCPPSVLAQAVVGPPVAIGDVTVTGSLRARAYAWQWFGDAANGDYTYPGILGRVGLSQSKTRYDWQLEIALPVLLNLPTTASVPAPQGQLGLGGNYFAANSNRANTAAIFLKQSFIRFNGVGGIAGQSVRVGRMEFNDGSEVTPKNSTLAFVKRDRISQRLLGTFGFSDVGRSIDGGQYTLTRPRLNVTAIGGRPTQGVFQVNGWPELNVNVFYGAVTGQVGGESHPGEWRVFGLAYDDYRHSAVKTDNRPMATRGADTRSIAIATYGGHYLQVIETPAGSLDLLLWGAAQAGSWGALTQRATAYAAEAGWQPGGWARSGPGCAVGTTTAQGTATRAINSMAPSFKCSPRHVRTPDCPSSI